jgi:nucleotide-binding universal stress UspA family protein
MTDVQRPADLAITHILVPVDGSGCALHACRQAAELARRLEARLTLCCVSDDLRTISTLVATSQDVVGEFLEILAVEARTTLRKALATIDDIEASAEAWILHGAPVAAIVAFASDTGADLVAMGSHGRSGIPRLVLGSVAEGVLRTSSLPVLIFREPSTEKHSSAQYLPQERVLPGKVS